MDQEDGCLDIADIIHRCNLLQGDADFKLDISKQRPGKQERKTPLFKVVKHDIRRMGKSADRDCALNSIIMGNGVNRSGSADGQADDADGFGPLFFRYKIDSRKDILGKFRHGRKAVPVAAAMIPGIKSEKIIAGFMQMLNVRQTPLDISSPAMHED